MVEQEAADISEEIVQDKLRLRKTLGSGSKRDDADGKSHSLLSEVKFRNTRTLSANYKVLQQLQRQANRISAEPVLVLTRPTLGKDLNEIKSSKEIEAYALVDLSFLESLLFRESAVPDQVLNEIADTIYSAPGIQPWKADEIVQKISKLLS